MLPISLTMAGIAALINIWLGIRCGQVRQAEKISIGDGGNEKLIARMRAQANFIENIPLLLILILLIEMALGSGDGSSKGLTWLWVVSALIMIGRVLHALGMDGTFKQGRAIGTMVTMLSLLGLAIYAIALPHMGYTPQVQIENISDTQ